MNKAQRQYYLNAMGIDVWETRQSAVNEAPASYDTNSETVWQNVQQDVQQCTLCGLCKTRTQTVFGVGNRQADLMIIGEAPGANEDKQGEPFVGRAGQLLNKMLAAIELERGDIFIANILKCRPPNNRDPSPEEVQSCTPYLQRQVELLQPKVILAVGRIAAQFLLDTKQSLSRLRGTQHAFGEQEIPLFITYHPAYLLRSPREKKKAYLDLLKVNTFLRNPHE